MPGLNALMAAVRVQESQDSLHGYEMTNGDALGAYQFERAAFITTGYIVVVEQDDGTFVDTWPGKNGITGYSDWLDITNPDIRKIQDSAFLEWIMYQWRQIRGDDAEPLAGQTLNGVELTISGMVLGAHLIGETDFRTTYIRSGGTNLVLDGNGKSAADYEQQFGGYDLTDLTGVDPDIIPAGFVDYFVTNHDLANTFNRHSDDNVDLIGNANTDDYPMHMGTGNDRIYGFGGDDTVYGASGGDDYLDGGTDEEGDVLSYAEFDGPVSITLVGTDVHAPSPTPVFVATTADGTDTFLNFEAIVMTEFSDTFIVDPAAENSLQEHGIDLRLGGGDDHAQLGGGSDTILAGFGNDTVDGGGGIDLIAGGLGADALFGGGGDDFIFFDHLDGPNVTGGDGRDTAWALTLADGQGVTVDMGAQSLEVVIGSMSADTIVFRGAEEQMAAGGEGDDSFTLDFTGEDGLRTVWGGAGVRRAGRYGRESRNGFARRRREQRAGTASPRPAARSSHPLAFVARGGVYSRHWMQL